MDDFYLYIVTAHSVQIINVRCMCRAGGVVLGTVKVARFLALAYSATDLYR